MALKIIGGLLIAFGLLDLIGSFAGLDVWGEWIGVQLPEVIWRFSAYIELALGFVLFKMGGAGSEAAGSDDEDAGEGQQT